MFPFTALNTTFDVGPNVLQIMLTLLGIAYLWMQTKAARTANKELRPNGGNSMKDRVDSMDEILQSILERMVTNDTAQSTGEEGASEESTL